MCQCGARVLFNRGQWARGVHRTGTAANQLGSTLTRIHMRLSRSQLLWALHGICYGWQLQSRLLDVGSHLATPLSSSSAKQIARMHFDDDEVAQLERWIDKVPSRDRPLKHSVSPPSSRASRTSSCSARETDLVLYLSDRCTVRRSTSSSHQFRPAGQLNRYIPSS